MTPREVIAKAWAITKKERRLRRWGYFGSLFETMRSVELLLYQAYYLYWYFQDVTVGWWSVEVMIFQKLPFWLFIAITAILLILFVLQLFMPTLASGAVIGLGAKAYRKEEMKGGLVLALYNFFPILELHALFVLGDITTIFTICSMLLRYVDGGLKYISIAVVIALGVLSFIFNLLASFAEEGVVIRKLGVFDAIGKSVKLILANLGHVMFLIILILIISLRVIINAVMIFLIPAIVLGVGFALTTFLSTTVSAIIAGVIGVVLLIALSYFFAYLHVFKQTVWTITYLELNAQKDADVILE